MKFPVILCLFLAVVLFIMPAIATAATDTSPHNATAISALSDTRFRETPVQVTTVPVQAQATRSGEVEYPVTRRETPTPTVTHSTVPPPTTITGTTIPATPTVPVTTIRVTQTITVPVVTVTVLVYPSGPVYQPVYYYPPGYPYSVDSYYQSGLLTVTSNPSNAVIILDGYNYGTTPYVFTGLTTGYHTIEVDYPGYEAYVTNVYVDSGSNNKVYADLTALVSYGSFFIDSTPRGADVYVDGNYQGTSPLTVSAISRGQHQIELHKAGYEVLTSTQNVDAGQGTVVNLVLIPYSSSSSYGSIDITSNQPGALVYLDGIYKGSTQSGTTYNIIAVSPGTHALLLHLPGYSDILQTTEVNAGQISKVNAVFVPSVSQQPAATAPSGAGSLIVTSAPSGGQVSVDNQFRGVTPVTIYNVVPGTHIINLHLNGYSDYSTSVDVPANQVVQVPATLVPAGGTTTTSARTGLSGATALIALTIGIVFLSARTRK